jgi:4-amino-4-deoxy-L-arabinose transferase-like glycosyltransferase
MNFSLFSMAANFLHQEQPDISVPMRSRLLWILSLLAIVLALYGLGNVSWPRGPLFILRLLLKPLSFLLLFWLGTLGLGDLSLRVLKIRLRGGERLLFSAGLGLVVWWLGLLGCGLLGLFRDHIAWTLLLGTGFFGLWRWPLLAAGVKWRWPRLTGWSSFLWAIVLVSILYPLLAYGLLPPLVWDEIAYHLAIPKIYITSGRIIPIPHIFFSYLPSGLEMLYTLALLIGQSGEVLSHMMHWSLALLTFAGLCHFGFQQKKAVGLLAGAIFLSLPVIKELEGTSLIDVGLAAYSCLAFMAWWYWRQKKDWHWLCLAGLMAGGAGSVKLTGASVALLLSGMTLLSSWRGGFKAGIKSCAQLELIALMVASPWYIRSWFLTGDPIFPFGWPIFQSSTWDALGAHFLHKYLTSINMPFTVISYLTGAVKVVLYPKRFDWLSLGYGLILLIPLSVMEIHRDKVVRWLFLFVIGYYSMWFFLLNHLIRFLLPLLPMAALLAARGGSWLITRSGSFGKAVIIVCLLLELPIVQAETRAMLLARIPYLTGEQSRSQVLASKIRPFPVFEYINHWLPKNARLLLATYEVRGYYLDRDYMWAHPIAQRLLRFEQVPDGSSLRQLLAANGIDYLLDNRQESDETLTSFEYYGHFSRLLDAMIVTYGEELYSESGVTLYRLSK